MSDTQFAVEARILIERQSARFKESGEIYFEKWIAENPQERKINDLIDALVIADDEEQKNNPNR